MRKERLSTDAGEQGSAQREQVGLAGKQGVVFVKALAESVAGIKDDRLCGNARLIRDSEACN